MKGCQKKIDGSVKIQRDGSIIFSSGARKNFRNRDIWSISFFHTAAGSGSRALLERERRALGLRGSNPYAAHTEDNPLEFLQTLGLDYKIGKAYYAWYEPKTKGVLVRVE